MLLLFVPFLTFFCIFFVTINTPAIVCTGTESDTGTSPGAVVTRERKEEHKSNEVKWLFQPKNKTLL